MSVMLRLRGPHGSRRVLLDCPHGTTTLDLLGDPSSERLDDRVLIAIAMTRHEADEGCGCVRGIDTVNPRSRGS
jgi:hypothetical protein